MTKRRKVNPRIEIRKGDKLINAFLLNRTRLVIGSAPGAHVRLKSPHIRPEHLVIELVNRRYLEAVNIAQDPHLRFEGESFVRARLSDGATVTLGNLSFRLTFVEQDAEPAPAEAVGALPDTSPGARALTPPAPVKEGLPSQPLSVATPAVSPPSMPRPAAPPARPTPPPTRPTPPPAQAVISSPAPGLPPTGARPRPPAPPPQRPPQQQPPRPMPDVAQQPLAAPPRPTPAPPPRAAQQPAGVPVMPPPQPPPPGQAPGDEVLPFLLIYPPTGGKRKRVRLPAGTYDIGRRGCDVNLNYEGIADLHASLMAMPDGNIYVQDRGSGLPTLLNGTQVSLSPFQPGDNLQIGTVTFGLEPPAAGVAPVPQPAVDTSAQGPGAGAWVQAALRGDRSAADQPPPPGEASGPMPVRRIGKEEAERAQRVAKHTEAMTDPHVTAKDWVRQALEDSERRKRGEVVAGESAPSFTGNAGPRTVKRKKARRVQSVTPMTGPERAAAARFSKLQATMSFLPAYHRRKRRRTLAVVAIVVLLAGGATAGVFYVKKLQKEARANDAYHYVGNMDRTERGAAGSQDALDGAAGSYEGVQRDRADSKQRKKSRGRSGGRSGARSGGRSTAGGGDSGTAQAKAGPATSDYTYDDGIVLSEAGTDEVIHAGDRAGPVYGPGGSKRGSIAEGERLRGGYVYVDDPDVIAIGNPGANAPVIAFGSPNLDGMMYDESEGTDLRGSTELEFELADDTGPAGRGFVDMRAVENVLHGLNPSTRMCYSRALENSPGLKGSMVLILTLGTSGQMTSVSLDMTSSTLTDVDLKRCIERQIKSRNYPIPDGGSVTFSYPFRFNG